MPLDPEIVLGLAFCGLRTHGLQAERFTCEITQSVAMEDTVVAEGVETEVRRDVLMAQTFSSPLFKDTLPLANGQAPTRVMTRV